MRLTWKTKKEPWQPVCYQLSYGGKRVGTVAYDTNIKAWYWYGLGCNSLLPGEYHGTYTTADDAKIACKAYVQKHIKKPEGQ